MSRMLYFMQVPWDWVKQRPHFLAQHLACGHEVTVVYNKPYTRRGLVHNDRPATLRFKEPYLLPFAYLSTVNSLLVTAQLKGVLAESETVWLTHPFQYAQIGKALSPRHRVVYDCMDDNLGFAFVKEDESLHRRMQDVERALMERSDLVIASSAYLKEKLVSRYGRHRNLQVVNNGIEIASGAAVEPQAPVQERGSGGFKIVSYIGTIAEWFDFDLVLESLSRYPNILYRLYGPARISIPRHERLKYCGRIEHAGVVAAMRASDALVMPFLLEEMVLSVNPVKLYEYIYSHRAAISVAYGETMKFEPFVHLYRSPEEYHELIGMVARGALPVKKSESECMEYARSNSWQKRAAEIAELLGERQGDRGRIGKRSWRD